MDTRLIPLFEKAAAIAIKLEEMDESIIYRPEWVLRRATAEEIDFYYAHICGAVNREISM